MGVNSYRNIDPHRPKTMSPNIPFPKAMLKSLLYFIS